MGVKKEQEIWEAEIMARRDQKSVTVMEQGSDNQSTTQDLFQTDETVEKPEEEAEVKIFNRDSIESISKRES